MCRGASLGTCCAAGCSNPIRCQDTNGYCPEHDPNDWERVVKTAVDDPAKRRTYTLSRLIIAIAGAEQRIRNDQRHLAEMHARVRELS